jgi:hypothetical protein
MLSWQAVQIDVESVMRYQGSVKGSWRQGELYGGRRCEEGLEVRPLDVSGDSVVAGRIPSQLPGRLALSLESVEALGGHVSSPLMLLLFMVRKKLGHGVSWGGRCAFCGG